VAARAVPALLAVTVLALARRPAGVRQVDAAQKMPIETAEEVLNTMLWALVVLLLLLWIGGFTLNVAGGLIHLLLVIALIVAVYNLVVTRGRAV
jgi:hypothetical protein